MPKWPGATYHIVTATAAYIPAPEAATPLRTILGRPGNPDSILIRGDTIVVGNADAAGRSRGTL